MGVLVAQCGCKRVCVLDKDEACWARWPAKQAGQARAAARITVEGKAQQSSMLDRPASYVSHLHRKKIDEKLRLGQIESRHVQHPHGIVGTDRFKRQLCPRTNCRQCGQRRPIEPSGSRQLKRRRTASSKHRDACVTEGDAHRRLV
eukprot:scaffold46549_cov29-Tisochrysis_lutea.AAC.1